MNRFLSFSPLDSLDCVIEQVQQVAFVRIDVIVELEGGGRGSSGALSLLSERQRLRRTACAFLSRQ